MVKRRFSVTFFVILAVTGLALAGVIRDGSFTGTSDGNNITIRWVSEDESGVLVYKLERKAGTAGSEFFHLADVPVQGNNANYAFVDNSAFRATQSVYQYRLKIANRDGSSMYYGPITVTHLVSSVGQRTWGSIKAMFR
jgi:hypothetical protein